MTGGPLSRWTVRHVPIGIKTSPQAVDWATLDGAWARIGEHEVFESVWMNDTSSTSPGSATEPVSRR